MSDTRLTLPHRDALADLADDALPLLPTALLIARDDTRSWDGTGLVFGPGIPKGK
jgi:hypothetical protein